MIQLNGYSDVHTMGGTNGTGQEGTGYEIFEFSYFEFLGGEGRKKLMNFINLLIFRQSGYFSAVYSNMIVNLVKYTNKFIYSICVIIVFVLAKI